jgi:7,8-dihydropterin-6-yl-methyl-4-(beta-D-ribofuranosyl)aminobenzene 5'-phosphate synthase
VLRKTRKSIEVVCHPDVWASKYSVGKDGSERFIGIPCQRLELESLGARFAMSREPVVLAEDVTALGEVPMVNDFETVDPHLFVRDGAGLRPDDLLDDRAVVVDSGDGLVVVLGCAHRGLVNTLKQAQKLTGVERINLVVGGSHLVGSGEERVWQTVAALKQLNVERLGLCHCTSLPAAAILAREFGDRFFFNNVGKTVEAGQ